MKGVVNRVISGVISGVMKIRRYIPGIKCRWFTIRANFYFPFYMKKRVRNNSIMPEPQCNFIEVATVAFNVPDVIQWQIRSIKKFLHPHFRYTVFDNSTNDGFAAEIERICRNENVGYVRLPKQRFIGKGQGSYSHAIACNYIFRHYISKRAMCVMLLDHDIFLVKKFNPMDKMRAQPIFGHMFNYGKYGIKYLWPGLWMMKMDFLRAHKDVDFRPSRRLDGDTGVLNYQLLDIEAHPEYIFTKLRNIPLKETSEDVLGMGYSMFDDEWLHCWNACNYARKDNMKEKMQIIYKILEVRLGE